MLIHNYQCSYIITIIFFCNDMQQVQLTIAIAIERIHMYRGQMLNMLFLLPSSLKHAQVYKSCTTVVVAKADLEIMGQLYNIITIYYCIRSSY